MGCSIGVATITADSRSPQEVLSRADFACHQAKRAGRNRVHVFEEKDEANVAAMSLDMGWSRRIKDAIEHNQFVLVAQPIVDTRSKQATAYEVLLRLRDERGELIMPNGFLPSAERFGLATQVDRWVIVHAIRTLATLIPETPGLRFSINLSGQTLSEPDICDLIIAELRRTKLDPSALTFEVTETVAIANMLLAETFLGKLKTIGCSTALDDFGSGMSSFAYLRELPVDYVKIDGRFVRNMAINTVDQAMVRAMNDIAHALGKRTIAEFVENEECFHLLCEYGVDYAQGMYLGRPELIVAATGGRPAVNTDKRIVYLNPR
jgi:EAL domain-containing protein (putative c-di-GMP-specific phosphodiesterase class I)